MDLLVVMYGKGKLRRSVGRRSTIIEAASYQFILFLFLFLSSFLFETEE